MFASRQSSSARKSLSARRNQVAHRRGHKPVFETLEDRQHFSVVTVTNTLDSGAGSLRAAITQVDAGNGTQIDFSIPKTDPGYSSATGMWTINVKSQLPAVQRTADIDGYSQEAIGVDSPLIEINAPSRAVGDGITLQAPGSAVYGLAIEHFDNGITIAAGANGCTLTGNLLTNNVTGVDVLSQSNAIGTGPSGNFIKNNSNDGIDISNADNTVFSNILTNNGGDGIALVATGNADYNTMQNNTIAGSVYGGIEVAANDHYNTIVYNSISQFGEPGINLHQTGNDGVTAPVISSAKGLPGYITVAGNGKATPNSTVLVQFFANSASAVTQGYVNDGVTYIGAETVHANAEGAYTFSQSMNLLLGTDITATATVTQSVLNPILHFVTHPTETSQFSNNEIADLLLIVGPRVPLLG